MADRTFVILYNKFLNKYNYIIYKNNTIINNMIGIEVFAGSGGMALGATLAGVNVKIAIEKDTYAAETYRTNHKSTKVINDDIVNIKQFQFNRNNDQVVLFGGPPCQGFSNSNQKTRSRENTKNWLFKEFVRCTRLVEPDWVVIENVRGLTSMDKGFFLKEICTNLNEIGYNMSYKVLNAAYYGVPQRRERVFIVGNRKGINFEFPKPTHANFITVEEAICDLPRLSNGDMAQTLPYYKDPSNYAQQMRGNLQEVSHNFVTKSSNLIIERYRHVPQGGNWKNIPKDLMRNYKDPTRCHHGIYRRLKGNEPSTVIGNFRKNMLIHPNEDRGLSIREAARLQSFPDDYKFCGPLVFQQQQVGDAVPPLLAKAVFTKIIASY